MSFSSLTISVQQVRWELNNLGLDAVADETVNMHIIEATSHINGIKARTVPQALVDQAILLRASYSVLLASYQKLARGTGILPDVHRIALEKYEAKAKEAEVLIMRATSAMPPIGVSGSSSTNDAVNDLGRTA